MIEESGYEFEESFLHIWAPAITDYVEWVLDEAIQAGKRRLYFLARDGWMMYHAAQRIIEKKNLDIEARYLKVSRYAIRSAEYHLMGEKCLDLICVGGIDVTFEKLMKRALLTDEEARHIARLSGYEEEYKTVLNYRQIQELKVKLKEIKLLFKYIEQHSKLNYENTIGYLNQEGLLENTPYALVDSGWIGTLQMSIQHLVSAGCGEERRIDGYYYGLYDVPKDAQKEQYKSFYFGKKSIWRKVYFSNCLFEAVFSSPEGMTVGYERHIDVSNSETYIYLPVESSHTNPNRELMMEFKGLLMMYVDERLRDEQSKAGNRRKIDGGNLSGYGKKVRSVNDIKSVKKNFRKLARLMSCPTQAEAESYGDMQFCDDIIEFKLQPVAAEWDLEEIRKQHFINKLLVKLNIRKQELHESAWPEGSITNAGGRIKSHLRQERMYKLFMYTRKAIVGK